MYYCLFEQSGTFKNEFKKLGYEAIDYDIQNEFNETDKHETEKELELINEKQKKFVYELFKESYEVLGIGGVLSERK